MPTHPDPSDSRSSPDGPAPAGSDAASDGAAPPPVPPPPDHPRHAGSTPPRKDDSRMWASFCHLAGLVYLLSIPGIAGSLVIWLWKRHEHPFIDEHGKEAVNFQITVLLFNLAVLALAFVTCGLGAIVAVPLVFVVAIVVIVFPILATIAASDGRSYRYPFTLRLID